MRRIAIINQKGGVGKTTTSVNVGAALARAGFRVLAIDLDPQAHLTLHLGVDPSNGQAGSYDLLTGSANFAQSRVQVAENLWVVGSSIDLAAAEVELVGVVGREVILRDLLEQHTGHDLSEGGMQYDYVLMDCPPSLNVLTLNGLCAAEEVIIPLQPHYLALQGLGKLLETVSLVNKRVNSELRVSGIVICMKEAGTKLAAEVIDDVRAFLNEARGGDQPWSQARVFETMIRRNIKLAESPSYGQSIFDYAPESNGAQDYQQLAGEIHDPNSVLSAEEPETAIADPQPPVMNETEPPAASEVLTEPDSSPDSPSDLPTSDTGTRSHDESNPQQEAADDASARPGHDFVVQPETRNPADHSSHFGSSESRQSA